MSRLSRLAIGLLREPKSIPRRALIVAEGSAALACAVPPRARINPG